MSVKFEISKRNCIGTGIGALVGLLMFIATRYPIWAFFLFAAALFLVTGLRFEISREHPLPWFWSGLIIGLGQFITTFLITALYIRFANKEVDPRAESIRLELEGGVA